MKKTWKATLLIIAVLTVVSVIASGVMLKAVSGDALFYMNSQLGNIYAVSYRWVCLASGVLILFWILLGIKKREAISAKLPRFKHKAGKEAPASVPATPAAKTTVFCTKCGKQQPSDKPFCPFCGEPVNSVK